MNEQEKSAIQHEQHLKLKQVASDEIVNILAINHFTISEAIDVLMIARKKLFKQDVKHSI